MSVVYTEKVDKMNVAKDGSLIPVEFTKKPCKWYKCIFVEHSIFLIRWCYQNCQDILQLYQDIEKIFGLKDVSIKNAVHSLAAMTE